MPHKMVGGFPVVRNDRKVKDQKEQICDACDSPFVSRRKRKYCLDCNARPEYIAGLKARKALKHPLDGLI